MSTALCTEEAINDFIGSAQVLVAAFSQAVDAKVLEEAAGPDFTLSQLKLLRLVSLMEDHSIGGVAAFLGVSSAAASKAVDRLVQKMYMRRSEGEKDRRVIHLSLTEPGRRLLANFDTARRRRLDELFGAMNPEELNHCSKSLQRISARLVELGLNAEETCLQCGVYFRERCVIRDQMGKDCNYNRFRSRRTSVPEAP